MFHQKFRARQMVNARSFQKHLELSINKKIRAKIVISSLMYKVFRYQKLSETPKGALYDFLELSDEKLAASFL